MCQIAIVPGSKLNKWPSATNTAGTDVAQRKRSVSDSEVQILRDVVQKLLEKTGATFGIARNLASVIIVKLIMMIHF